MQLSLNNNSPETVDSDCLVLGVCAHDALNEAAERINSASGGVLKAMVSSCDINTGLGKVTTLHALAGVQARRVLIIGFGKIEKLSAPRFDRACRAAGAALRDGPAGNAHVCLHAQTFGGSKPQWRLRQAALGVQCANYIYTATKAVKEDDPKPLKSVSFHADDSFQNVLDQAAAMASGILKARYLGDLPANICNPAFLADEAAELAAGFQSVELEVLEEDRLNELGMNALLGVAQGSTNRPKLIVLSYQGAAQHDRPYVFVGKGITFDSGGLSLKSPSSMDQMKYDMCGAASVMGAMMACAQLNLPLNLVCIVPAVENMPDAAAYRPGDILTSMSGQTIEVLNTDAEGRLILCDAMTWSERLDPVTLVDVATLTGAVRVALGTHASGLLSNDEDLAADLIEAGEQVVDRAWRLPLWDEYQSQLDTPYADMKNVGGSAAGTITAACFLSRFATEQRWAHIDVAATAFSWDNQDGASGRPVGLLTQYLITASERGSG